MIADRKLRNYIMTNQKLLSQSGRKFCDIYRYMFSHPSNLLAETEENYRIKRYTYGDVKKRIEEIAAAVYERIGNTNSYVALEMENCIEWIYVFWAILKSGNKPYLVNCRHPQDLSNDILKSLDIKYIFALRKGELSGEYILYDELSELAAKLEPLDGEEFFENELAVSTSATSLRACVCFYGGEEISRQILDAKEIITTSHRMHLHYKGYLKQLAFLPFYHIFGLFAVYFWFTYFGRAIVFLNDYSPDTILQTARRHEVTHIFAVPVLWHTIEEELLKELAKQSPKKQKAFERGVKFCNFLQVLMPQFGATLTQKILGEVTDKVFGHSIKFCISGGSYVKETTLKLINSIGYPLHNGYGMSEIGITSVELRPRPRSRIENSVGRPFESIEYRINDKGVLEVKGTSLCKCFMIDGVKYDRDEWFETGDLAREKNGNWYIIGRIKDTVISDGGENINPDMYEPMFDFPKADAFSILGLGDLTSQKLSMVIKIGKRTSKDDVREIKDICEKVNSGFKPGMEIKNFYLTYDEIMNPNAIKVSRPYLERAIKEGAVDLMSFEDFLSKDEVKFDEIPLTPEEEIMAAKIIAIISERLGIKPETVTYDSRIMHDLNATSLQFFGIQTAVFDEFMLRSMNNTASYCNTVREFIEYIESVGK